MFGRSGQFRQQQSGSGFTLLELLIVIAIIGILASIVLVATNQAKNNSHYTQVLKQLEQIDFALKLYISDVYKTSWPRSYSKCQRLDYMVTGDYSPSDVWYCKSSSAPPGYPVQRTMFTNFSNYLGGVPVDPEFLGWYLYQADSPKRVSLTSCPDANVTPQNPSGGVLIRVGDESGNENTTIPPLFNYIDKIIDHSDGMSCGKIRMRDPQYGLGGAEIYYILAEDRNDVVF